MEGRWSGAPAGVEGAGGATSSSPPTPSSCPSCRPSPPRGRGRGTSWSSSGTSGGRPAPPLGGAAAPPPGLPRRAPLASLAWRRPEHGWGGGGGAHLHRGVERRLVGELDPRHVGGRRGGGAQPGVQQRLHRATVQHGQTHLARHLGGGGGRGHGPGGRQPGVGALGTRYTHQERRPTRHYSIPD